MIADSLQAEALFAYICQHPAEDDVRLAFADLLEQRGEDEHAEFVRCQVELAALEGEHGPNPLADCVRAVDAGTVQLSSTEAHAAIIAQGRLDDLRRRERELLYPTARGLTNADRWGKLALPGVEQFVFRRGFPAEVTLTALAFAGGPCGRCGDKWRHRRPDGSSLIRIDPECPDCRGTGKTPGHAAALFRAAPVEKVTLSGKRPEYHLTGGGARWSWYCVGFPEDAATLPVELFDLLPGSTVRMNNERRIYPTEQAAHDALAAAALLLGRRRGWPCPRCKGEGWLEDRHGDTAPYECYDCHGTGHTVEGS